MPDLCQSALTHTVEMTKTSLDKAQIKFLLLEGIHPTAVNVLKSAGYSNIESISGALEGEALAEKIADAHFIGIRSRTQLTADVFAHAHKLAAVGCFCIGTNQVDLGAAREKGIAVFNAPFSNTRSVAELVLAEAILLLRTGAVGSSQRTTRLRFAAKRWASSATAQLVRSCQSWLKAWACMLCFLMW